MSKYERFSPRSRVEKRPWDIHPVWRGIGCVLLVLIPVMAYAGAVLLVQMNLQQHWWATPPELMQAVNLPGLGAVEHLFANLLVGFVLTLVGYAILVFLYSFVYRLVGPPRLGPMDAPPIRAGKKRRR